jgi:hypothetical protein
MPKSVKAGPVKPPTKPLIRLPQRSTAISGNESKGLTPIAAVQKKKPKTPELDKIARAKPKPQKTN